MEFTKPVKAGQIEKRCDRCSRTRYLEKRRGQRQRATERGTRRTTKAKACNQCGGSFVGASDRNYCSLDCQYQWKRDQGKPYECPTDGCTGLRPTRNSHYCSPCIDLKAQRRTLIKTLRLVVQQRAKPPLDARACGHCGAEFMPKQSNHYLCSDACSKRHNGWNSKARGRQVAEGGSNVYRYQIVKRDRGCCQLCGDQVDFTVGSHHSRAPSMDHIVPLGRGGLHEPTNVQLAHMQCNRLKSDGSGIDATMASRMLRDAGFGGPDLTKQIASVLQALDQAGWYADELDLRDLCLTSTDPTQGRKGRAKAPGAPGVGVPVVCQIKDFGEVG